MDRTHNIESSSAKVLDGLRKFGHDTLHNPEKIHQEFQRQLGEVTRIANDISAQAVFISGYPLDAWDVEEDIILPSGEVARHIADSLGDLQSRQSVDNFLDTCICCTESGSISDFKIDCVGCPETDIKPRDWLKFSPDLDIWIYFQDDTIKHDPERLRSIEDIFARKGYKSSDRDIRTAARSIIDFQSLESSNFPIDLHIVTLQDVLYLQQQLNDALRNEALAPISISPLSMYMSWKPTRSGDEYDLLADVLMGMQFMELEQQKDQLIELQEVLRLVSIMIQAYTPEDFLEFLYTNHPSKYRKVTSSPEMKDLFDRRLSNETQLVSRWLFDA